MLPKSLLFGRYSNLEKKFRIWGIAPKIPSVMQVPPLLSYMLGWRFAPPLNIDPSIGLTIFCNSQCTTLHLNFQQITFQNKTHSNIIFSSHQIWCLIPTNFGFLKFALKSLMYLLNFSWFVMSKPATIPMIKSKKKRMKLMMWWTC